MTSHIFARLRSIPTPAFLSALAFGLLVGPSAQADQFTANWLGGTIWEQDGAWSTTAYPNNGHIVVVNGNPVPGPNPTYDVSITNPAPCTLGIGVNVQTVNVAQGATLNLGNTSAVLTAFTGLGVNGLITSSGGHLRVGGTGSGIASGGVISFSDQGNNALSGSAEGRTFTIFAGGTIRGGAQLNVGYFGGSQFLLNFVNHGLINATQPNIAINIGLGGQAPINSNLTNDGVLQASASGTLRMHAFNTQGTVFNAGGIIRAIDNGQVRIAAPVIVTGGTLETTGNGIIRGDGPGAGSGTLRDLTNNGVISIPDSEQVRLGGAFVNNGTIRMSSTPGTGANLYFTDDTTLSGTGTLTMSNSANNYIYGTTQGDDVTLAAGAKIEGGGNINPGFSGTGVMDFANNGLINANLPAGINFGLANNVDAKMTNTGILRASNGSTLRFHAFNVTGAVNNAGGTIEALEGSSFRIGNALTVTGGTLVTAGTGAIRGDNAGSGSGVYRDLTNTGTMAVAVNEALRIAGNFINNGTVRMDSVSPNAANLYFSNNTVIGGTGVFQLTDSANNYIFGDNGGDNVTFGPGMTLRGGCQISPGFSGTGIMNLNNQGLIESTSFINIGLGNHVNASMVNSGTLRAVPGATLNFNTFNVQATFTNNGGTLQALSGATISAGGGLTFIQNSGTIDLRDATMNIPLGIDLNGGQLVGNGTIAPGLSPGKITIEGNYTQGANGVLNMEIGGNAPGSGYDQLRVVGTATLGGTLNIRLINGYRPAVGDVFEIIDPNAVSGSFAQINAEGFGVQANYAAGGITVTVTSVPDLLLNISTRLRVGTGENALIGGFIITGTEAKKVIIRAIGPSLSNQGVTGALANPTLDLVNGAGDSIAFNDNWKESQQGEIEATQVAPSNDAEAAIVRTLAPGNYTAVVRGSGGGTGVGLVEVFDLAQGARSQLVNISSRGFVEAGENVLIGGFIVGGGNGTRLVIRAIGTSLRDAGVEDALQDPTLQLVNANGSELQANDNWKSDQQAEIQALQIAPSSDLESALVATLPSGNYTAVVRGKDGGTGVGLVEVYNLR